jgi:hypothetical protein
VRCSGSPRSAVGRGHRVGRSRGRLQVACYQQRSRRRRRRLSPRLGFHRQWPRSRQGYSRSGRSGKSLSQGSRLGVAVEVGHCGLPLDGGRFGVSIMRQQCLVTYARKGCRRKMLAPTEAGGIRALAVEAENLLHLENVTGAHHGVVTSTCSLPTCSASRLPDLGNVSTAGGGDSQPGWDSTPAKS